MSCPRHLKLVAPLMGLGHLRALDPLRPCAPDGLAIYGENLTGWEPALWRGLRHLYEGMSRGEPGSWRRGLGNRTMRLVDPPFPWPVQVGRHLLSGFIRMGILGAGMNRGHEGPWLHSFYTTAHAWAMRGVDPQRNALLICDQAIHPIWLSTQHKRHPHLIFLPHEGLVDRLGSWGADPALLRVTGFPLPGTDPRGENWAADAFNRRLHRMEHPERDVLHLLAVQGGAGAQARALERLLKGAMPLVDRGSLKLTVVCGHPGATRHEGFLGGMLGRPPVPGISIIPFRDPLSAIQEVANRLPEVDLLWSKPSELVQYTALGLPLLCADPIFDHEVANRDWVRRTGAGLLPPGPWEDLADWLTRWWREGTLARAARDGWNKGDRSAVERIRNWIGGLG